MKPWPLELADAFCIALISLRHAMTERPAVRLELVFSKSTDIGSNAERVNEVAALGGAGVDLNDQIVKGGRPRQRHGLSDFDLTHQINRQLDIRIADRARPELCLRHRISQAVIGPPRRSGRCARFRGRAPRL